MLLITKYIDDLGEIVPVFKKVVHNITDNSQLKMLQEIVDKFNQHILIIRGQSDFGKLRTEASILETEKYILNIKNQGFSYYQLPEPAFGSAIECISKNLSMICQIECQKFQSYFENIRINLVNLEQSSDKHQMILNEVRSNGIVSHTYTINFSFSDEWSETCQSCSNGLEHVRHELNKMSNYLYVSENNEYDLQGMVISDLNVSNSDLLKDQLLLLLKNAFSEAKIVDISVSKLEDKENET